MSLSKYLSLFSENSKSLFITSVVLFDLIFCAALAQTCQADRVDLRGEWGSASFRVSVADNSKKRAMGLMHVEHLPKSFGMLFVYDIPQHVSFWMKNTLMPLDMLFFDSQGILVNLHKDVRPHDIAPRESDAAIKFVLEINGGIAGTYSIKKGKIMRHPSIGTSAFWLC